MSAIVVENLSKRYLIGHAPQADTLRDALSGGVRSLWTRLRRERRTTEDFWALRDISFRVEPGEVVGIIGRNGAGKSTLLKILSRITEPTTGRVTLRGRVASLLEVGTGFHPELTGRENIFLNGAILGMSRAEIRQKFDEIVAFSEVEKFLDTPVKRYSSGMYVRLAFAVAAHLEPEILIVDEVLAVGDAQFQKKCLGKIKDISNREGRTVLFVSHNLAALAAICTRGVELSSGQIVHDGSIQSAAEHYLRESRLATASFAPRPDKPSITSVQVDETALTTGELVLEVGFKSPFPLNPPVVGAIIYTAQGHPVFGSNTRMHPMSSVAAAAQGVCHMRLSHLPLHLGSYLVSVWLGDQHQDYDHKPEVISFMHTAATTYAQMPPVEITGPLDLICNWTLRT